MRPTPDLAKAVVSRDTVAGLSRTYCARSGLWPVGCMGDTSRLANTSGLGVGCRGVVRCTAQSRCVLTVPSGQVLDWTTDQKSVETRSAAKAVIVALFELNTAEFTRVLQQLPNTYQVGVSVCGCFSRMRQLHICHISAIRSLPLSNKLPVRVSLYCFRLCAAGAVSDTAPRVPSGAVSRTRRQR